MNSRSLKKCAEVEGLTEYYISNFRMAINHSICIQIGQMGCFLASTENADPKKNLVCPIRIQIE